MIFSFLILTWIYRKGRKINLFWTGFLRELKKCDKENLFAEILLDFKW